MKDRILRGRLSILSDVSLGTLGSLEPIPDAVPSQAPDRQQLDRLLEMVNVRQPVEESALAVSGYLAGNGAPEELLATMGRIMLPEDADFHSSHIVGAALERFESRKGTESWRHVMIGVSRFLSAHSPTPPGAGRDLPDSPAPPARRRRFTSDVRSQLAKRHH